MAEETTVTTEAATEQDNRPSVYLEDDGSGGRRWVFRASALGRCARELWGVASGFTPMLPPDWLEERWAQGAAAEPIILKMLEDSYPGMTVVERQGDVEVRVGDRAIIRGHIDGIGMQEADPERVLVEAKCFGDSYAKKWERCWNQPNVEDRMAALMDQFPHYLYQMGVYAKAKSVKKVLFVIGIRDDDGKVLDIDVYVFPVELLPGIGKIKARVLRVLQSVEDGMPPCDVEQYPCSMYFLHEPDKDIVIRDDTELLEAVERYHLAKKAEDYAAEERKELGTRIKKLAEGLGLDKKFQTENGYEVQMVKQTRKGGLDEKKMAEAGVNVEGFRKPAYVVEFVKVTPKTVVKEGGDDA